MAVAVLFVCVGNIARSALAERLLSRRLAELAPPGTDLEVDVCSAGVHAMREWPMESKAAAELERRGGSSDGFVSQKLTEDLVAGADVVLAATRDVRSRILADSPEALRKTFTMREFAALLQTLPPADRFADLVEGAATARSQASASEYDVPDPFGQSASVHRQVADLIDEAVTTIAGRVAGCRS